LVIRVDIPRISGTYLYHTGCALVIYAPLDTTNKHDDDEINDADRDEMRKCTDEINTSQNQTTMPRNAMIEKSFDRKII